MSQELINSTEIREHLMLSEFLKIREYSRCMNWEYRDGSANIRSFA